MRQTRTLGAAAALLLSLVTIPLGARQQPAFRDSLLDRLAGQWVLRGVISGQPTTHDVTAEWVLGHQYLRLHEVSREMNAGGAPEFEADVYIGRDAKTPRYACPA